MESVAIEITNPRFDLLSTQHGISQKTVQAIFQDSHGFLWFGTQEGLNKYDGQKITIYRNRPSDISSISNDVIRDIKEDRNGDIWVATSGGLNRYISEKNTFERVELQDRNNKNIQRLNSLFVDSQGALWVGSDGNGIFKGIIEKSKVTFEQPKALSSIESDDIRIIFEDSRARLWIGTDGSGVVVLNKSDNSLSKFQNEPSSPKSLSHNRIRSITEDYKGRIWIGTRGGGANKFEELTKSFERYSSSNQDSNSLSHNRVYQIFEDSRQKLWFATDGGLSIYKENTNSFIRIQNIPSMHSSLSHNRVSSIFQDKSGLLWFGTLSGVNKWNPFSATFVNYRHLPELESGLSFNHIHGLAENSRGNILIATFGGGLNVYDPKTNYFGVMNTENSDILDNYIITIKVDSKNNIWVGTLSQGVQVLNAELDKVGEYRNEKDRQNSLSDNGVTSILEDREGEFWISTYRKGLNRLNSDSNEFKHYRLDKNKSGLVSENIYQVVEDDEGYIWLATDGGGISRLNKNTDEIISFTHNENDPKSISGNAAWSIYQDSKGRFWIGTQGNGLNRWEPEDRRLGVNNFIHYNLENGLNSSTVNGVVEDENGFIWISTVKGVSRLNPDTNVLIHFDLADEIHQNELNQGAILRSKDGRLYFGGLDGISAFYPQQVKLNSYIPPVVLTQVLSENRPLLFDEPIHQLKEVTFDHNDYLVSFDFASLDYSIPKKNQYQYKLEGFDNEWIKGGTLNRATFTNLPSGSYVLKVKGSNNDGVWSDESINLKVNVQPAPWLSWWAYSLYGIVFCIIIILMIRSQAKRLANQEMFQAQVSDKVFEKTELYLKNNNFLKEQLESIKNIANVDIATGLPNQKYFSDLVAANVGWVKRVQLDSKDTRWRMVIGFIRIEPTKFNPAFNQDFERIAKNFVQEITISDQMQVVRWGSNEIGLLSHFNCEESLFDVLEWKKLLQQAMENLDLGELNISIAYSISPLGGIKDHFLDGDDLMMLTEHLLHLVEIDQGYNIVGVEKLNQPLNNVIFKQILEVNKLSELSQVFNLKLGSLKDI